MDHQLRAQGVGFDRTAADYSAFRAGFPVEFFQALADRGWIRSGQKALDLGAGTGTVARGLALVGLSVTGIDTSASMLAEAAVLDADAGVSVQYRVGSAEELIEHSASVDVVTAGQCWHWFNRPVAAREVARVLTPGGRVIIAHFDWLPLADNVVEATEALIEAHNPAWTMGGGAGIYPAWLRDLGEAGFGGLETFSFDLGVRYSHEAWLGRVRASAGVSATLEAAQVKQFNAELAATLRETFPEDPLVVPHRVWAVTGVRP